MVAEEKQPTAELFRRREQRAPAEKSRYEIITIKPQQQQPRI